MTTAQVQQAPAAAALRPLLSKVPEVTCYFWITKVLTTGMGEAASDTLAHVFGPIVAVGLAGLVLVASLVLQLCVRRYVAAIYWTAVVMVSVFGTMAADVVHVALGVPYVISTVGFSLALAVVFAVWYAVERTLSIHSITTRRRELFYWTTVMTTFALGTAAGDWTASNLGLGYLGSGLMFAAVIAVPALLHWKAGLNAVLAFWFAYVVTRPLGASFADWMAVSHERGGLDLGLAPVTLAWLAAIVAFVVYLSVSRKDVAG